jgi:transposase
MLKSGNFIKQGCFHVISVDYSEELQKDMISFYNSLSEKDRRRYAAIEARKLGHGGISYISLLFVCDDKTISKGMQELKNNEQMSQETIRAPGGGRPSKIDTIDNIDVVFLEVLKNYTAGDPMDKELKWTNLTRAQISEEMGKKGIKVSRNIVRKILKKHGFSKRKAQKKSLQENTKIEINNLI